MGIETCTTDERLREVRFKAHIEGKTFDEVSRLSHYQESLLNNPDAWHRFICTESPAAFQRRIVSFLRELPKEKEILICSHAGTLQKILQLHGLAKAKIGYLESIRREEGGKGRF
jgi:broad specificity phosphatase PhoE